MIMEDERAEECGTPRASMNRSLRAIGEKINAPEFPKYGWICPVCKRVMAPHIPVCLTNHALTPSGQQQEAEG